jgi:hypothetical protein
MKLNKLNATYPEFTKYLLDQQKQTSSASSTPNNFLYYNSRTRSIEGVSMVSSFTLHKLSATKSLTLLTVSPQLAPTTITPTNNINFKPSSSLLLIPPPQPKIFYLPLPYSTSTLSTTSSIVSNNYFHQSKASLLPFFHQFIYTIKVNTNKDENLANKLNEPSIEASRMRASLVRSICSQLDMSPTSLRFNWIEMLQSNRFESKTNDDDQDDEKEEEEEEEEEGQEVTSSEDYYDNNTNSSTSSNVDDNEPEFITEYVR